VNGGNGTLWLDKAVALSLAVSQVAGKRLTYVELTAKQEGDPF
jgi:hypothetical protein